MTTDPLRPSDRRVQTVCLLTLTILSAATAMWLLRPVLVPFVLALFLAQCLAPIIDLLVRHGRFPRVVAVTAAALVGVGVLTGAGFLIASAVGRMNDNYDAYADGLKNLTNRMVSSPLGRRLGVEVDGASVRDQVKQLVPIANVFAGTTGVLTSTGTVVLLMIFILYGREGRDDDPRRAGSLIDEVEARVQRYITLTLGISVLTGVLVGSSLSILHVQFAVVFGLLAFLLNFIPNVGGVIATLLPLPVVLLAPDLGVPAKVLAFAIPGGVQLLIGSLIQPRVFGKSLDLHPVVIVLSLLFFAYIWGVAGAFLAVPLTAVIRIVFERIPSTRPLAAVLAGNLGPLTNTIDSPAADAVTVNGISPATNGKNLTTDEYR